MKLNKFIYVLAFVLFFLFTIPLTQASSAGSTIAYTDGTSDKTITEGEDVTIEAYGDSVIYDITKVELILHELDSGDDIIIYEKTGINSVFYSLNSGTNTTISSNTTITASQGTNNLILYANDSTGKINSTSVSFEVDSRAIQEYQRIFKQE